MVTLFICAVEIGCYIEYARYWINTWVQESYYLLTNSHSTLEYVASGGRMTGTQWTVKDAEESGPDLFKVIFLYISGGLDKI